MTNSIHGDEALAARQRSFLRKKLSAVKGSADLLRAGLQTCGQAAALAPELLERLGGASFARRFAEELDKTGLKQGLADYPELRTGIVKAAPAGILIFHSGIKGANAAGNVSVEGALRRAGMFCVGDVTPDFAERLAGAGHALRREIVGCIAERLAELLPEGGAAAQAPQEERKEPEESCAQDASVPQEPDAGSDRDGMDDPEAVPGGAPDCQCCPDCGTGAGRPACAECAPAEVCAECAGTEPEQAAPAAPPFPSMQEAHDPASESLGAMVEKSLKAQSLPPVFGSVLLAGETSLVCGRGALNFVCGLSVACVSGLRYMQIMPAKVPVLWLHNYAAWESVRNAFLNVFEGVKRVRPGWTLPPGITFYRGMDALFAAAERLSGGCLVVLSDVTEKWLSFKGFAASCGAHVLVFTEQPRGVQETAVFGPNAAVVMNDGLVESIFHIRQ